MTTQLERCSWASTGGPNIGTAYLDYHDRVWGVPERDPLVLFEFLVLEGAQAGLSWLTILRKRENYRCAFDNFDIERIARYDDNDVARLLGDAGIVRNKLKIRAAIDNARAAIDLRQAGVSLGDFFWRRFDHRPVINHWRRMEDVPVHDDAARALSRDLRQRGFRFVGPTIIYSYMQATGMVNDHLVSCPRHGQLAASAS